MTESGNVHPLTAGAWRWPDPVTHGILHAPDVEQLLDPDPERFLAGGPLHERCAGGEECSAMCVCDGDE